MTTLTPVITTSSVLITWSIVKLGTAQDLNSLSDAVVQVTWQCQGQQLKWDESEVLTATRTGTVMVQPSTGSFTPYDQLTEDQVMGWVNRAMGEEGLTAVNHQVFADIYAQQNPLPLPWSN